MDVFQTEHISEFSETCHAYSILQSSIKYDISEFDLRLLFCDPNQKILLRLSIIDERTARECDTLVRSIVFVKEVNS